ncbi:potassium/proton antiporter [Candidatus Cetobacterium colombiensis]|uniref:Potassium/proton antiporter n=1 Tax=Candidatus Cetobacterium colombiensis TaxID=3073100 RepID=A0ABU4WBU0_9FUSO|nr:potassium/proton antiporter [Candidatus Cetobacterium colombiensis]MDX8336502.1 potassium/proton antiporter [Candidatus Cetobacterium colombiensis]
MGIEILVAGVIILISLFSIRISKKLEIPLLIMFLLIGMLAGSEGVGKIYFDNALVAQNIGTIALMFIIFSGGLETKKEDVKKSIYPSGLLATLGVLLTAILSGIAVYYLTDFTLKEALLFSAMVSSTDAAAVMSILGDSKLKKDIKSVVDIESGSNDPMAYALILFLLSFFKMDGNTSIVGGIIFLLKQIVLGGVIGYLFGLITLPLAKYIKIVREEFLTIHLIAILFICFGLATVLNGNGFLAIYISAIMIGNQKFNYKLNSIRNMRLITWFMQIGMFVMLGLLVFPTQLLSYILIGSLLSIIMIIIIRILVVYSLLWPFKFTSKEKFFISWAGLKGAVPIIFATMAITEGLPNAQSMFNLTFYIVVFSVLIQGMTLKYVGKKLNLFEDNSEQDNLIEVEELEELALKKMILDENSEYINKLIRELELPKGMLIVSIKRDSSYITPKGEVKLLLGDIILFSQN